VSRRPTRSIAAASVAVLALLAAPAAFAVVSCSVAASGVAFGIYTALSATPLDSTGTVTVTCTLLSGGATNVNLTASLSAGSSGNFTTRTMLAGTSKLNYNLYWSNAYQQVWGDGTGGSYYGVATVPLTPANPTQQTSGTMYGQIAAGQDVAPGAYLDTIVVTVTY
jgi:spore coat protein U-like protein